MARHASSCSGVHPTPVWGGVAPVGWKNTPHENRWGGVLHPKTPPHCGVEFGPNLGSVGWSGVECLFQIFSELHPTVGWSVGWSGGIRLARSARNFSGLCAFKGKPLKTDGREAPENSPFPKSHPLHPTVGWSVGWSFWTSGVEWGGVSTPHGNAR